MSKDQLIFMVILVPFCQAIYTLLLVTLYFSVTQAKFSIITKKWLIGLMALGALGLALYMIVKGIINFIAL